MEILEQIAEEMKNQKVTKVRVADELGVSYQSVQKWFSGKGDPSMAHLIDMAWLLGYELKLGKEKENE